MNNPESPSVKTEPAANPQHQKSDTETDNTAKNTNQSPNTGTGTDKKKPEQISPEQNSKGSRTESEQPAEHGGPKGLEPTRYGDWEQNGRCTDF